MRKSEIVAEFSSDIETVWGVVCDNANYAWRSDLSKIEILDDGKTFIEHTKDGFQTTFTVTAKEPYSRYEFDMENKNFTGHWVGIFSATKNKGTRICFTEELKIKNPIMEVLSHIFMDLKKIQITYVRDLKNKLGEE